MTLPAAWLSFLGGLLLLIASSRLLVWAASNIALPIGRVRAGHRAHHRGGGYQPA